MQAIDSAALREGVRETCRLLGYANFAALAKELCAVDRKIKPADALRYLRNQSVGGSMDIISQAVATLMSKNIEAVIGYYHNKGEYHIRDYLEKLLEKYGIGITRSSEESNGLDLFVSHWRSPFARGNQILQTGIYQIFRRYMSAPSRYRNSDDELDNIIISELILFDSEKMECRLVTAERYLYWGIMYINRQQILHSILQRPDDVAKNSVYHRMYSLVVGRRGGQNLHSGICMKTGDAGNTTASECIFLYIEKNEHQQLYEEFESLINASWSTVELSENSIISDYLTGVVVARPGTADDLECRKIRRVKDFPMFEELVRGGTEGEKLFRSPLRTLDTTTVLNAARQGMLSVFRHKPG